MGWGGQDLGGNWDLYNTWMVGPSMGPNTGTIGVPPSNPWGYSMSAGTGTNPVTRYILKASEQPAYTPDPWLTGIDTSTLNSIIMDIRPRITLYTASTAGTYVVTINNTDYNVSLLYGDKVVVEALWRVYYGYNILPTSRIACGYIGSIIVQRGTSDIQTLASWKSQVYQGSAPGGAMGLSYYYDFNPP
ncbi:MAG: hypothetical protein LBJ07_03230, partial [Actinomycetes bacterium]|nr:hypothetical protein [Actinomycetes bacterium]